MRKASLLTRYKPSYATICCGLLNLMSFIAGVSFSWASPCIPYLDNSKGEDLNPLSERITLTEMSWLTAFVFIGAMLGNLLTMVIVKKVGRKMSIMIMIIPSIVSYLLFALVANLIVFYFARVLNGITLGATLQIVPVYVGELASKETRGALGCFYSIFLALGQLYVYGIGPLITFTNFNFINLVFPSLAFVLITLFVEESPYHYIDKGEIDRAERTLRRLRPEYNDEELKHELQEIQHSIAIKREQLDYVQLFNDGALRKTLLIAVSLNVSVQLSIINAVVSYMEIIFENSNTGISAQMSSVYVALLQLVVVLIVPHVIDRIGRKILLCLGQSLIVISITSLGTYFYLKDNDYDVDSLTWLPLASILLFIVSFGIGIGSVTYVVLGEILPDNAKNVFSTISIFMTNITAFAIVFAFPLLEDAITAGPTYWIFSGLCAFSVIFFIFFLPETKGKSLIEIQNMLRK